MAAAGAKGSKDGNSPECLLDKPDDPTSIWTAGSRPRTGSEDAGREVLPCTARAPGMAAPHPAALFSAPLRRPRAQQGLSARPARRGPGRPIFTSRKGTPLTLSRRSFVGAAAAAAAGVPSLAAAPVIRIGFQKYGTLLLLKAKGTLEPSLAPLGCKVMWTEFPSGPPLLEALGVGAIDFGITGETPPIFAQAAGAPILYVGHEPPAPMGEAILVPRGSPINSVTDLKGRKVALNKGSNVHYFLVEALAKAGIAYADVQPVFLAPAEARAAFVRGSVDAWAIWEPYLAAAQAASGARTLTDATGIAANHQFYLAEQRFAEANPLIVDATLAAVAATDGWAKGNARAAAAELSPQIGIAADVLETALSRESYGVTPLGADVVAAQQRIADTFFRLGLVPKAVDVASIVRRTRA